MAVGPTVTKSFAEKCQSFCTLKFIHVKVTAVLDTKSTLSTHSIWMHYGRYINYI